MPRPPRPVLPTRFLPVEAHSPPSQRWIIRCPPLKSSHLGQGSARLENQSEGRSDHREYRVELDIYNGPVDLLLYLIKRDELDIYDIPIARITDSYMQ